MRFKIKCKECGATEWFNGSSEEDVNFAGISDKEDLSECCQHVADEGDYEIVDQDYSSDED